ncbi:type 1 glutamine amidotransferase [Nisaea sp.]|uniref:type 1 glutamine amidotransferase n=1 Tax=Nisaea sp. TaxID=2024842 RepID=UPI0032658C18
MRSEELRVLVIENYKGTDVGEMAVTFADRGITLDVVQAFNGTPLPVGPDDHDGMIVLGGDQNALDDSGSPYFPPLLDLIRAFDTARRPVLGICLGAQLLARAHGGGNIVGDELEFGYVPVTPTAAGIKDPLTAILDPHVPIFEWHSDTFTLPPGAIHLATSKAYRNQAYSVGNMSYGTQFHFEVGRTLAERWSTAHAGYLDAQRPGWRPQIARELEQHEAGACAFCAAFTNSWIDLVADARIRRSA